MKEYIRKYYRELSEQESRVFQTKVSAGNQKNERTIDLNESIIDSIRKKLLEQTRRGKPITHIKGIVK